MNGFIIFLAWIGGIVLFLIALAGLIAIGMMIHIYYVKNKPEIVQQEFEKGKTPWKK